MTIGVAAALVAVLVLSGAAAGTTAVVRRGLTPAAALEADPSVPRLSAEVRTGAEQVLVHLARRLALPTGREETGYGQVYLASSGDAVLRLASRSEIGRGYAGEVRVRRTRRSTVVDHVVLQVPGDEAVQRRVLRLEDDLTTALVVLDPEARFLRAGGRRVVPTRPDDPHGTAATGH